MASPYKQSYFSFSPTGSLFDVRDFHFLLLNHGPMPLSVMETIVNDYITDSGGRPDAGSSSIIIG